MKHMVSWCQVVDDVKNQKTRRYICVPVLSLHHSSTQSEISWSHQSVSLINSIVSKSESESESPRYPINHQLMDYRHHHDVIVLSNPLLWISNGINFVPTLNLVPNNITFFLFSHKDICNLVTLFIISNLGIFNKKSKQRKSNILINWQTFIKDSTWSYPRKLSRSQSALWTAKHEPGRPRKLRLLLLSTARIGTEL